MTQILILRGGAIGDFILTVPAINALQAHYQGTTHLIAYPRMKDLALLTALADSFGSLDSPDVARLFADGADVSDHMASRIVSSDVVVSFLHDPEDVVTANLEKAGAKKVVAVSPMITKGHAADHFLESLAQLGVPSDAPAVPRLKLPQEFVDSCSARRNELGDDVIVLHPSSGSPAKNWPTEKFAELARRLKDKHDASVVFLLGEADEAAADILAEAVPEFPVIREQNLAQLAGILAASVTFVGNDSGMAHLAAALGARVLALFGPTDPDVWSPRGDAVRVLRAAEPTTRSLRAIEVEQVMKAFTSW